MRNQTFKLEDQDLGQNTIWLFNSLIICVKVSFFVAILNCFAFFVLSIMFLHYGLPIFSFICIAIIGLSLHTKIPMVDLANKLKRIEKENLNDEELFKKLSEFIMKNVDVWNRIVDKHEKYVIIIYEGLTHDDKGEKGDNNEIYSI